jgi:hypothetical protein
VGEVGHDLVARRIAVGVARERKAREAVVAGVNSRNESQRDRQAAAGAEAASRTAKR